MDDVTAPNIVKARRAEHTAAAFLRASGYSHVVVGCGSRGPDIVCKFGPNELRVEVKSAIKQRFGNSWYVASVSEHRKHDDIVAIVFPGGLVVLESMTKHLAACLPKSGKRTVTRFLKEAA